MVIFSLKLLNNLRKAIAGRRFPHQLAGGLALGVLLGVIPHGNLLALFVLIGVLCFRVNHAMMGVTAILVSFGATSLDTYSDRVGSYVLRHPEAQEIAVAAWSLPVVPWTDLNNTVVMGSFLIGVASVLPIFYLTLPVFKWIAPAEEESSSAEGADPQTQSQEQAQTATTDVEAPVTIQFQEVEAPSDPETSSTASKHSVALFDQPHQETLPPRFDSEPDESTTPPIIPIDSVLTTESEFRPHDAHGPSESDSSSDALPTNEQMASVETRIDVIRMTDYQTELAQESNGDSATASPSADLAESDTEQPMDEALRYLLRQLRHSQQRKAAG